jgi:hypothetical protein
MPLDSISIAMRPFLRLFFRRSPWERYLRYTWGRCKVQGCGGYSGDRPLCRKHMKRTKYRHLTQRGHAA